MIQPNDNAYPSIPVDNPALQGLTKREYFAAMAMQAIAANQNMLFVDVAEQSVQMADALINALNK